MWGVGCVGCGVVCSVWGGGVWWILRPNTNPTTPLVHERTTLITPSYRMFGHHAIANGCQVGRLLVTPTSQLPVTINNGLLHATEIIAITAKQARQQWSPFIGDARRLRWLCSLARNGALPRLMRYGRQLPVTSLPRFAAIATRYCLHAIMTSFYQAAMLLRAISVILLCSHVYRYTGITHGYALWRFTGLWRQPRIYEPVVTDKKMFANRARGHSARSRDGEADER